jgi:hypothetical protein
MIGDAISEMRSRNCGLEVRATVGSTLEVGKRSRLVAEPVEMFEIDCAMRWHFNVIVRIHTFGPLPVSPGSKRPQAHGALDGSSPIHHPTSTRTSEAFAQTDAARAQGVPEARRPRSTT